MLPIFATQEGYFAIRNFTATETLRVAPDGEFAYEKAFTNSSWARTLKLTEISVKNPRQIFIFNERNHQNLAIQVRTSSDAATWFNEQAIRPIAILLPTIGEYSTVEILNSYT